VAVNVRVPGALRTETGGSSTVDIPLPGGTLGQLLDRLRQEYPRLERRLRDEQGELRRYVNVYVDGEECRRLGGLATEVPDGAEIFVVPSVAGG
jgi:sulfur-carrier protein